METGVSICSICLQCKTLLKFASEECKTAAISVVACYFLFEQNFIPKHQICVGCWHQITTFDRFSTQIKLAHELHFKEAGTYFSYVSEGEEKAALILKDEDKMLNEPCAAPQTIAELVDAQVSDRDTRQICPETEADSIMTDNTSPAPDNTDIVDDFKANSQRGTESQPLNDANANCSLEDRIPSLMSDSYNESETDSDDEMVLSMRSQSENQQSTPGCHDPLLDINGYQDISNVPAPSLHDCDEPEYLDDSDDSENSDISAQQQQTQESIGTEIEIPIMKNLQQESDDEEKSLLDMILMDIDNEIDINKTEDASDKNNETAQCCAEKIRGTDELISQHCNLECVICGAKFSNFPLVMRHFQSQHNIKGYIMCCGEQYTTRRNLLDHVILQNNPNAFTCDQCLQSYLSTTAYRAHLSTHRKPDGKIYSCEFCGKQFPKRLLLMIHRKNHAAHKCDQCDASFKLRRDLREHKLEHQDENIDETKDQFVCKVCSKSHANRDAARRHYANIHGPARYMCESCPESFKSHFTYSYHKRTKHSVTNIKPVQCTICERLLKSAASLRKHMFLHEPNKKPLVCDICGKVAKHPQSLISHKRYVHAKECPFECLICKKTFVREKALKEHMAVHTGASLYQCSFCSRTFKWSANMHAHRKKTHPVELEELFKQRSDELRAIYEQQNGQKVSESSPVPTINYQ
ncbi:zinc finger protein 286A-like [Anopheles darlingi]|uniref:zinc finger protein 286A-like n=1 Tax=Anopheles darlingi TaxID=43151 RepID=UPI00210026FA|nr:zinc finger protein 286A-like [Anopheles darlingi]